jgi:peptidoglycan/xylan/chitin deacetylase (PgdA/CDA1 family)
MSPRTVRPLAILMYHNVAVPPLADLLPGLYVHPQQFERQMRLLDTIGYRAVGMSEGIRHLRGEDVGRIAVVTLDDGYADNVENALPVLKRFGFSATCYVTSTAIGSFNRWDADRIGVDKPIMSDAQLGAWVDAGMEVGAHTRTHAHLRTLTDDELTQEIAGSKAELEERIGGPVTHFCYPYGEHDERVERAVKGAGFETATTVRRARARRSDDAFRLPRVQVRMQDPLIRFLVKVVTNYEERAGNRAEVRRLERFAKQEAAKR